ncbi:uncharacterized protein LOC113870059 [Abrus precatorius]|uniref:Uncharacterized protein LOC113870059 n=1 Tax=Abrus precatorius TaxID=3816 RepID=A0A8B8M5L9_ABRPR|nr:uncharacterized protein LOC113870059 [Abrus precatorius]
MGLKPIIPKRVFAMSGVEVSQSEELIRGKCIIKGQLLDVLFDSGATHSFVYVKCVKNLGLHVTELPCNVVGLRGRLDLFASLPIRRDFGDGLASCQPCAVGEKTLVFGAIMTEISRLLSQSTWENTVSAKAFMVMFSMEAENVVESKYIIVVRNFLEVFPEDVSKLPLEREIEFSIDLIPRASSISVAPYRMSPVELEKVKK